MSAQNDQNLYYNYQLSKKMDEVKRYLLCLSVLPAIFLGTDTASGTVTVITNYVVAVINDSTFFNCSASSDNVEWLFGSNQYPQPIIYSYGEIKKPYSDRFQIENYNHSSGRQLNLKLLSVTVKDAGLYIYRNPDSPNEEEMEVHLIVLDTEPTCAANWSAEGVIGPNSCGIEPETIQLSCSVRYTGNKAPILKLTKSGEDNSASVVCSDSGHTYTCNLTMNSTLEMDGSSYVCQTTESATNQYSCTSEALRIIYAIDAYSEINATVNDKENCAINSSQPCNYTWKFYDSNGFQSESYGPDIDLKRSGTYICEAICPMRDKNCTTTVKKVVVSPQSVAELNIPLIVGLSVGLFIVIGLLILLIIWMYKTGFFGGKDTCDGIEMESRPSSTGNYEDRQDTDDETKNRLLSPGAQHSEGKYLETKHSLMIQRNYMTLIDKLDVDGGLLLDHLYHVGLITKEEVETMHAKRTKHEQNWTLLALVSKFSEDNFNKFLQSLEKSANQLSEVTVEVNENLSPDVADIEIVEINGVTFEVITPAEAKSDSKNGIRGITLLNQQLFISTERCNKIEVYDSISKKFIKTLSFKSLLEPGTMASCRKDNCIYLIDKKYQRGKEEIFKFSPDGKLLTKWSNDVAYGRLSVIENTGDLVLTAYETDRKPMVKIFSAKGKLINTIKFSKESNIMHSWHAVKLSQGGFVVGHGSSYNESPLHRVCKIDDDGNLLKSFGGERGSGLDSLNDPTCVIETANESILVADMNNHRVLLLSKDLEFPEVLFAEDYRIKFPEALYFDEENERLYVACNLEIAKHGRVICLPYTIN